MPIFSNTRPLSGMQQNIQRLRGLPMLQSRTPPMPAPQVSLSPAPLQPQPPMAQQPTQQQMQQMQQMAQQLTQQQMQQQPTQQQMQQMTQQLTPQQMQQMQQMAQMAQQQLGSPGFTLPPGIMPMVPAQLPQPLQQGIGAVFQQQLGLGQMPTPSSPLQQQAPIFGGVNSALQSAGLPTFQQLGQQGFGQMPPPFGQSPFGQQQAPIFGGVNSALQSAGLPTFQQLGQQGLGQMPPPFGQPQQQETPLTSQSGAANAGGKGLF